MRHFLVNIFSASLIAILLIATPFSVASAVAGVPTVISYQGRLTDANGILLGGTSGTNYYFKFSIWDSATVGGGTRLWPASAPGTISLPVTEGVFNVNIGDTGTGYPDALTYNFQDNDTVYLQVEVSTNGSSFETPGPRQRITSSGTAINAKTLGGNLPSYFLDANNLTNFQTPFNTALAGVTADAVAEGTLNKYFTSTLFDSSFATKTSDNLTEGATNKYFTASNFNTSFATKSTTDLAEGSNLYYTDVRARAALSATGPITYDNITGVIGIGTASSTTDGALTATDWNTFNTKQNAITTGTTAQYLRGDLSLGTFPTALSAFTNDQGFLTSVSNGDVLAAIGYTPYDATNPDGYITASSSDTLTNKGGLISQWTNDVGYVTSGSITGFVPDTRTLTINGATYDLTADRAWTVGDVSTSGSYADPSWITSLSWAKITSTPTTLSGYGITDAVPDSRTINGYSLSSDIALTTDDVPEGSNLYFTDLLAQNALAGLYEVPLTFSTGLTRTGNTITNNLSTGISGGQSVVGGTASGENLTLSSTGNATKGKILFGNSAYDEVNNRLGLGTTTPTSKLDLTSNSLGATQTTTSGIALVNTTTAALGAQQISPALRFSGNGWKTVATAASQAVDFRNYLLPVQGTTAPSGTLVWDASIAGGSYTNQMELSTAVGQLKVNTTAANGGFLVNGSNYQALLSTSASGGASLNGYINSGANAGVVQIASNGGSIIMSGSGGASSWGVNGIATRVLASTYTDYSASASSTVTNNMVNTFGAPTLAASSASVTFTNAATVYIAGAPAAGTNTTLTNPYALMVASGNTSLGGNLLLGAGATSFSSSANFLTIGNTRGLAYGTGATTGGNVWSIAMGANATTTGSQDGAIAIGVNTSNSGRNVAIGNYSVAEANEFVSGAYLIPVTNVYFGSGKVNKIGGGGAQGSQAGTSYTINGSGAFGTDFAGGDIGIAGGKATGAGSGGSIIFSTSTVGSSGTTLQSLSERMRIIANGNVGIGDATPASLFTVGTADAFQIDTSGVVVAGTWQGTAIADGYIASASTWNAKENTLTFSTGLTRTSNTVTNDLSTGVSGGQTVYGGTGSGDNLVLRSTTNATRGNVKIDTTSGGFNFRDYLGSIPAMYPGSNVTAGSDAFILASFGTTSMFYGSGGAASLYHYVSGGNRTVLTSTYYNIGVNTSIGLALSTTPSSKLEVNTDALGVTQTTSSGIALTNKTAAALAAQQISPALRWSGKGWGTTASTSQAADFRAYILPVQGAAQPSGELLFESAFGSSSYQRAFSVGDPTAAAGGISASVYGNGTQGQMRIYAGQASSFNQLGISVTVGTSTLDGASNAVAISTNSTQRLTVFPTTGFVGIGTAAFTPTSKVEVRTNSLGVTQTTDSGLALTNTTAAAAGAQQISPALRWSGQGWKTTATAASQSVDFRSYVVPVQGAANPSGYLTWDASINGGASTPLMYLFNSGQLSVASSGGIQLSLIPGTIPTIATGGSQNIAIAPNNVTAMTVALGGNVGIGQTVPTSKLDVTTNSLGVTQTTSSGLVLVNTTAAALGAQQISPALRFTGQGWAAGSSTSQSLDVRTYLLPIQGAQPTGSLIWQTSVNGAAYTQMATLGTNGTLALTGNLSLSSQISIASAGLSVGAQTGAGAYSGAGGGFGIITAYAFSSTGAEVFIRNGSAGGASNTSGARYQMQLAAGSTGWAPASGTGTYAALYFDGVINQTGGANGISRGIYLNHTLTAAADYRAIETSNTIGYSIYTSTADSYFGGSVGISNNNPGYLLHVGSASTSSGTTVARFENAGGTCDVTPNLVSGVVCTSDERFKENISTYEGSLAQVLALRPVSYALISDPTHESQIGFLAQELEQILPGLVRTDAQGNKAVLYAGLTPVLVGAIKDMDIRVKALELGTTTNGLGDYASLFFTDVMEKVEDGIAYVRSMVVGTLKVGTPEKRTGITLYDEETGDPYCLSIANGQTKTIEGECGIYEPEPETPSAPEPDPQPEVPSDTPSDTGPAPETTPSPEENPPVVQDSPVPEETPAPSPAPETPPEPEVQSDPQPEVSVTP